MKSIWLHSLIFKLPPQIHFTLKPLKAETKQYKSAKHASSSPVLCGIVFVKPKVVTRCFFTHFPCCFCPPPSPHPPLTRSKSQFGHNSFCNVLNILRAPNASRAQTERGGGDKDPERHGFPRLIVCVHKAFVASGAASLCP